MKHLGPAQSRAEGDQLGAQAGGLLGWVCMGVEGSEV